MPLRLTQAQAVAALEASGQADRADMVASMTLTPGQGVDFAALARVLAIVTIVYVVSSILSWMQNYLMAGVTQRTKPACQACQCAVCKADEPVKLPPVTAQCLKP